MKDDDVRALYKCGPVIGRGSTGVVHRGVHIASGRKVAIKIMTKKHPSALKFSKNGTPLYITREIAILRILKHPHVLKLWDVLETDEKVYLVLEYAGGGELFSYIMQHVRVETDQALRFTRQIVSATLYYHQLGICHRDLKPENILLDKNNNVKLADFGYAKMVLDVCTDEDGSDHFYRSPQPHVSGDVMPEKTSSCENMGTICSAEARRPPARNDTLCGSLHYASPELLARVLRVNNGTATNYQPIHDPRLSDVWAIGCILYAMITGSLPFDDDDQSVLIKLVCAGKFLMPSDIPEDVGDLIRKLLTVDPKKRMPLHVVLQHRCFLRAPSTPTTFLDSPQLPVLHSSSSNGITYPMKNVSVHKRRRSCGQIQVGLVAETHNAPLSPLELNLVHDLESLGLGNLHTITATLLKNSSPSPLYMESRRGSAASSGAAGAAAAGAGTVSANPSTLRLQDNYQARAVQEHDAPSASLCRELYEHFQEQQHHHQLFRHHVVKRRGSV